MTDVVLETPRLRLSPLTLGDLGALHALFIDADVRRWMADGRVYSEAHVRASIQRSLACFRRNGTGGFALRLREDATFLPVGRDAAAPPGPPLAPGQPHPAAPAFAIVGYAGLFDAKLARLGGLELGAGVWPRFWRTGLAAEACRAVLDDAFGRLGQARVLACTDAPNFRSLALIARLGFRQIATTPGVFGAVRWFALDRYGRQVTPTSRLGVTSG